MLNQNAIVIQTSLLGDKGHARPMSGLIQRTCREWCCQSKVNSNTIGAHENWQTPSNKSIRTWPHDIPTLSGRTCSIAKYRNHGNWSQWRVLKCNLESLGCIKWVCLKIGGTRKLLFQWENTEVNHSKAVFSSGLLNFETTYPPYPHDSASDSGTPALLASAACASCSLVVPPCHQQHLLKKLA